MALVAIVSGSPKIDSRLHALTLYAEDKLKAAGLETDTVDVSELPANDLISANFQSGGY